MLYLWKCSSKWWTFHTITSRPRNASTTCKKDCADLARIAHTRTVLKNVACHMMRYRTARPILTSTLIRPSRCSTAMIKAKTESSDSPTNHNQPQLSISSRSPKQWWDKPKRNIMHRSQLLSLQSSPTSMCRSLNINSNNSIRLNKITCSRWCPISIKTTRSKTLEALTEM